MRQLCGRHSSDILFEYAPSFLQSNIWLSPFKVPLQKGQFIDDKATFEGLFGLFDDSLPDGWGRLLLDRELRAIYGQSAPLAMSPLYRLAMAGHDCMGALEYEPVVSQSKDLELFDCYLDTLADKSLAILQDEDLPLSDINALRVLNGSSGGARPKILVNLHKDEHGSERFSLQHGEPWLIKFRNQNDDRDTGLHEYAYSIVARRAGIDMPETRLFASQRCSGFFGVKRFDRDNGHKVHVHSACGLLHANYRLPCMTYEGLLRLCHVLTRDSKEVVKLFRIMVFNVFIGNKDDHTKNFSFIMTNDYQWKLSPAYDLVATPHCLEHATTVNGKGRDISIDDILAVAKSANIPFKTARAIIEEVQESISGFNTLVGS